MNDIRPVQKEDLDQLQIIIDDSKLFPSELLLGMLDSYFNNPESSDLWFKLCDDKNIPIGIIYAIEEPLTNKTYNLLLIAIHSNYKGKGLGKKLVHFIENYLKNLGCRLILIDTSGTHDFDSTRKFYYSLDYEKVSEIPDYYNDGESKVTFMKKLV